MPILGPPPAGTGVSLRLVGGTTSELDLTTYINLVEGEGFDPADGDFLEPQFTDSSVGAGQGLVNIDTQNKQLMFPLHLKAATKDSLHTLVRSLRLKLDEPDAYVEWRDNGASNVTYYTLEYGRFEPQFRYHRARVNRVSGNLVCWVRPYGHTATERIAATVTASGHGAMTLTVPALSGDVEALPRFTVTMATYTWLDNESDTVAVGVLPHASYPFRWPAASMTIGAGATRVGASGAAGSQSVVRVAVATALVNGNVMATITPPAGVLKGRHRVLATVRSGQASSITFSTLHVNNAYIATTVINPLAGDWTLVDFGTWNVPSHIATQAAAALSIVAVGPSMALTASFRYQLNEIYLLPEDKSCLLIATNPNDIPHSAVATFSLDGIDNTTVLHRNASMTFDMAASLRGAVPAIPAGATQSIAVLRAPFRMPDVLDSIVPPSHPVSAELRVRERFSFQR